MASFQSQLFSAIFGQACQMPSKVDLDEQLFSASCAMAPLGSSRCGENVFTEDPLSEDVGLRESTSFGPPLLMEPDGSVPQRINLAMSQSFGKKLQIDLSGLQDPDWKRRKDAVAGLGSCHLGRHPGEFNQEAANLIMPALRAAMRDEHWEVRAQAATSLSDLGPEAVWHTVPVLWETCSDPVELVRQTALRALLVHGQEAPPEHLQHARLRSRSWQEPPSLKAVREDPDEDCESDDEDLSTTDHSGASSRDSSKFSKRDAGDNQTCVSSEFTMRVGKLSGSQMGIDIDYTHKDCLKVLSVHAGIIRDWNQEQDLWKLEPGDWIYEVNGRRGTAMELMDMLKRNASLEVLVRRCLVDLEEHSYI